MRVQTPQINLNYSIKNHELLKTRLMEASHPQKIEEYDQISPISFGSTASIAKNTLLKSVETVSDYSNIKKNIDKLWGGEYSKIEAELKEGLGVRKFAQKIVQNSDGSVSFVDEGVLPKLAKTALYPVKDMWLDIGNWAFRGAKKIPFLSSAAQSALDCAPFKNRANAKRMEDLFYTLSGACSSDVMDDMLHAASKVTGNYKTRDERTLNRIATGLVSSTMAGIDFYNIARMQHDDDKEAKKSQKKRFRQETSRILMNAAMTFLTLGALSKYANKSKLVALFAIAGTTIISEVLSRVFSGMPLRPLTPQEAKNYDKNAHKLSFTNKSENDTTADKKQTAENKNPVLLNNVPDVFADFGSKANKGQETLPGQKPQHVLDDKKDTKFKGAEQKSENEDASSEKKSLFDIRKIIKVVGAFWAAGMAVCFARSRSPKFDGLLKDARKGLDDAYNSITKKDYFVPIDNMDKMFSKLKNDFKLDEYTDKFKEALNSGDYPVVTKMIDGKNVECYKLGTVDKRFAAPVVKALTYPFVFAWGAVKFPVKILHTIFAKEPEASKRIIKSDDIIGIHKNFSSAMQKVQKGKMSEDELQKLIVRKTLAMASDKTGKSSYKNTSLAQISRPIVTLIASYFFVNDYRNEVLLASKGEDVEGANAVAKERVMHKVSNFFFNNMFMNLFNSVFDATYHGSLLGSGAVAAATEFTNENTIRKSIGVPTRKMTKAQLEEHDRKNLERDDIWGKYFRFMSKITGKKSISQKALDEEKKKAQKSEQEAKK